MSGSLKTQVIDAGLAFFRASGLHRRLAPLTRGLGAILTLHHVRPFQSRAFAPNRLLEIEPAFLDAALTRIVALGYDLVGLDEVLRRLRDPAPRPFVALTFDDGYRDLCDHALPILERHAAPFTAFVTTGFADRTARLWWLELERAVAALPRLEATLHGRMVTLPARTSGEKAKAFAKLYDVLRAGPEEGLRDTIARLAAAAGIAPASLPAELCLDWPGIRALARHPLCTIGAHTVSHPMLAKQGEMFAREEIATGRQRIEEAIGLPVRHLAYPVGDRGSAGPREFAMAASLGFSSGLTTRPGVLFATHAGRPTSLPRLSLNGLWQDPSMVEILLSGAPSAIWNRGRLAA